MTYGILLAMIVLLVVPARPAPAQHVLTARPRDAKALPVAPGSALRATLGDRTAVLNVVVDSPADVPISTFGDEAEELVTQIVIRAADGGAATTILTDQPFDVDLFVSTKRLPLDAAGDIITAQVPEHVTVSFVLPQGRGSHDLALRYRGGRKYSTASPVTVKDGGGGGLRVGGFDFTTVMGSSRLTGGLGSLDVREGETLTVRYAEASTEVRVHETSLKQSLALYRDGFNQVLQDVSDRLAHGGLSTLERQALDDPRILPAVRQYILANPTPAPELQLMERKLRYASHALVLLDSPQYSLDITRLQIAEAYAHLLRYARTDLTDAESLPGGASGLGFTFVNAAERDALSGAIRAAREAKSQAILRGAGHVAMGFYQWTVEMSGAGDFVMLAGINPMTGKPATISERLTASVNIFNAAAMSKIQTEAMQRLQDGVGTAGSRRASSPDERPAAPRRELAEPPTSMPPVPDRPAPFSSREMAQPPRSMPPVPERPAPLPGREVAQPPTSMPPVPDRPAPFPSREMAQPPRSMPPVPERPAPLPSRDVAQPPAATRPDAEAPARPTIEYPPTRPAAPNPARAETETRPRVADAPPASDRAARAETETQAKPDATPPTSDRAARAEMPTDTGSTASAPRVRVLDELRRTASPDVRRRMAETDALIDRIIDADPRLKQLDRDQLSIYVGLHAARRDATPAQLAAEALNFNGARVTPRQLASATGLGPAQADRAVRDGLRALQMDAAEARPVATPPREFSPPPGQPPTLPRTAREPALPPLSLTPPPARPRPLTGAEARGIVDRLGIAGVDRRQAAAYIAENASRPGVSEAQLAAEAVIMQGRMPVSPQLTRAAGLPNQPAGNAALTAARLHLSQSPQKKAALLLATKRLQSERIDQLLEARAQNQQVRDQQAAATAAARLQELAQRQAQAPRLPARPPGAPRVAGFMPDRHVVPGDTDYLNRIMGSTPYRPSQTSVSASAINRYVDDMLAGRFDARAVQRSRGPVVIDPRTNLVGGGHHRLIAATIVSRRTGRPIFQRDGPNAILLDPTVPGEGIREARGAGWALAVRGDD